MAGAITLFICLKSSFPSFPPSIPQECVYRLLFEMAVHCVWVVAQEQNVSGTADRSVFCLTGNTLLRQRQFSCLRQQVEFFTLLCKGANLLAAYVFVMGCVSSNAHTCDSQSCVRQRARRASLIYKSRCCAHGHLDCYTGFVLAVFGTL